jgi:hypothetical protein
MMEEENNQMPKNESEKKNCVKYSCKTCGNALDANPPR